MDLGNKGKVVAAIKTGKIKTASMMVGIGLMFFYNLPFELINIKMADFLIYFAVMVRYIASFSWICCWINSWFFCFT